MTLATVHGVPRIGPDRELKTILEGHWSGRRSVDDVQSVARDIRTRWWTLMRDAGVDLIPCNDFSLYDHVLDTIAMVGAVPPRFGHRGGDVDLDTYVAMARGRAGGAGDAPAMAMTKWFDTNYHHIVPEIGEDTRFRLSSSKPVDELVEARSLGITAKPVLLGPVTFLLLARSTAGAGFDPLSRLDALLDVYAEVLERLAAEGAAWVHLDEPAFAQDRRPADLDALRRAYTRLGASAPRPRMLVSISYDHAGDALPVLADLPVEGLGLDLVCGRGDAERLRGLGGLGGRRLAAGVVDGRGVWANDLDDSLDLLRGLREVVPDVIVSTSCSLLHVPDDVDRETTIDPALRSWLAFARQKIDEVVLVARALDGAGGADGRVDAALERARHRLDERRSSPGVRDPAVRRRLEDVRTLDPRRASPYDERAIRQRERLPLPPLPTTTIGSFPQTDAIRAARAALRRGAIDEPEYTERIRGEVEHAVRLQERLGLDVLVHGEPERNDMVQYFAERMSGFAITEHGWVQSYGTRCVRPPIVVGDVSRPAPITVEWYSFAQSLTPRPVKAMLTGPVTMLRWSFPRDDRDDADTCAQIALAIRDEVRDLEAAGASIIQVDEPALREGLPLRRVARARYLGWAARCFRLATSGVADRTQVHTHMCYAEFGDILDAVDEMDADVISLEASRSRMEVAGELARHPYRRQVGPGVYDVHSPRVPATAEMAGLLRAAVAVLDPAQVWVNPDCGLKTRGHAEVEASLRNMVAAAHEVRAELGASVTSAARPAHRPWLSGTGR